MSYYHEYRLGLVLAYTDITCWDMGPVGHWDSLIKRFLLLCDTALVMNNCYNILFNCIAVVCILELLEDMKTSSRSVSPPPTQAIRRKISAV